MDVCMNIPTIGEQVNYGADLRWDYRVVLARNNNVRVYKNSHINKFGELS